MEESIEGDPEHPGGARHGSAYHHHNPILALHQRAALTSIDWGRKGQRSRGGSQERSKVRGWSLKVIGQGVELKKGHGVELE